MRWTIFVLCSARRSNWFSMAPPAIKQGERNRAVTDAAIFAVKYLDHGVTRCPFCDVKNIGMATFAAAPYRVFLMGEFDVGHPRAARLQLKVLRYRQRRPLDIAFEHISKPYDPIGLRLFPVYLIAEQLFGIFFRERIKIIFFFDALPQGMAAIALARLFRPGFPGTGLKDLSVPDDH